jgi:hypothetical protein
MPEIEVFRYLHCDGARSPASFPSPTFVEGLSDLFPIEPVVIEKSLILGCNDCPLQKRRYLGEGAPAEVQSISAQPGLNHKWGGRRVEESYDGYLKNREYGQSR